MIDSTIPRFLAKAHESLQTAESEYLLQRYNSCANRCYYACFQAAVAALLVAGIRTPGMSSSWGHGHVQSQFAGLLVNRRKEYSSILRDTLPRLAALRKNADYEPNSVNHREAFRA